MPAKSRKRRTGRSSAPLALPAIGANGTPSPYTDKSLQQTMSSIATLERAIARILLLRFQADIARLYSARLYNVSQVYIPQLMRTILSHGAGPGWFLANREQEDIKDLFRGAIAMDLRQAGERTATKSILWSYTALRHFAMNHGVKICKKRGLHSLHLLPYFPQLQAHLDTLESVPHAIFQKPPQLGPLTFGLETVETYARQNMSGDKEWKLKIRLGYYQLVDTLWTVAREFDVRGYGLVLREKLTDKWCDCGCSTDHLGEVCEKTVREDEADRDRDMGMVKSTSTYDRDGELSLTSRKLGKGKEREWDGRGSGVFGWNTLDEEDLWEVELDFGGWDSDPDAPPGPARAFGGGLPGRGVGIGLENARDVGLATSDDEEDPTADMTIAELMEWRYIRAERSKEMGNIAFKKADYDLAARYYKCAHGIEPELPHYQLNLAAAYLKLSRWIDAERACTRALSQHRSSKGYYRRARARRMLGKIEEAAKDLRGVLRLQPNNIEAMNVLADMSTELEVERQRKKGRNKGAKYGPTRVPSCGPGSSDYHDTGQVTVNGNTTTTKEDGRLQASTSSPEKHHPFPFQPPTFKSKVGSAALGIDVPPDITFTTHDTKRIRVVPSPISVGSDILGMGPDVLKGNGAERFSYPGWERYIVKAG